MNVYWSMDYMMCLVKMNLTYKSSLARFMLQLQETESQNKNNRFVLSDEIFFKFPFSCAISPCFRLCILRVEMTWKVLRDYKRTRHIFLWTKKLKQVWSRAFSTVESFITSFSLDFRMYTLSSIIYSIFCRLLQRVSYSKNMQKDCNFLKWIMFPTK